MEKKNITQTKEALKFIFDLSDAIIDSIDGDGKITLSDAPKFLTPLRSAGAAIGGIQDIPKEITDIDAEEMNELTAYVAERFDIKNEGLEIKVENCLKYAGLLAVSIIELYETEEEIKE